MFQGVYVAVVTPYENGKLAEKTYADYIEKLIGTGITGIIVCGSTGESSMLTMEEHKQLFKISKEIVKNRIQVIANSGSNTTFEAIHLTREAEKIGADAALLVAPYYVRPTQDGLIKHFTEIHNATDSIPLILYNVPGRTGVDIAAETTIRLSSLQRYVGIKEAVSDMEKIALIVKETGPGFSVLSGNDGTFLPLLSVGGHGVISVIGSITPGQLVDIYESYKKGDVKRALQVNQSLITMYKLMGIESNPIPVKYALYRMGLIRDEIRLPLTSLTEPNREKIDKALKELGII